MTRIVYALAALALIVAGLGALDAEAAGKRPKARTSTKTQMPRSEVNSIVSFAPSVQRARSKRREAKQTMDNLADNIIDNQQAGGDWVGQRGTQRAINNAINAHGRAVRAETATVRAATRNFIRTNGIEIIPEPPSTPPPPLPSGPPPGSASTQLLTSPSGPPPSRKATRPAGGPSRIFRN